MTSERTAKNGPYAIRVRDRVEADEELKNRSARDLQQQGILGITIEEREIFELKYFTETGQHLDIVNWTLSDQIIRCQVRVGVAYGSEVREVGKLLYQAVAEHGRILKKPEPAVIFSDFGDNALIFDLYYWIQLGDASMEKITVESDVRFLIEKYFRENGITIPFPQRDMHLDTTQPLNLRILRDSAGPRAGEGVDTHAQ